MTPPYHAPVYAVVAAAGASKRMGRPKALLDIDGKPMLRAVVDTLLQSNVAGVAVVTTEEIAQRLPLDGPRCTTLINAMPRCEMIDSLRIGIAWWMRRRIRSSLDGLLVMPCDQPGVPVACIDRCVEAYRRHPWALVNATYREKIGHPLVFGARWTPVVRGRVCDTGLNRLTSLYSDFALRVACAEPSVIADIDTPTDYARWVAHR